MASTSTEDQAVMAEISSDDPSSMDAEALPGYLPWEKDLEMVSNFLDRKVRQYGCDYDMCFTV